VTTFYETLIAFGNRKVFLTTTIENHAMPTNRFKRYRRIRLNFATAFSLGILAAAVIILLVPVELHAYSDGRKQSLQQSIIDYRWRLNPRYKKIKRQQTRYIVVHTSESGLQSTLRTVSRGKRVRGRSHTSGGHSHYVIARDGRTFRVLDREYRADHAGLSMWDGRTDLSSVSIGIELVGYHYTPITEKQYQSLGALIAILQDVYRLDDRAVLTHSQVAYGGPNRWFSRDHRGRKRCAKNFERRKAGLGPTWPYDPDVRSGRLTPDAELAAIFYGPSTAVAAAEATGNNLISATNTAWSIAGEDFDSPTTQYRLPGGKTVAGDRVSKTIGWNRIPPGTEVLLNQEEPAEVAETSNPIKVITDDATAWSHAGQAYNRETTIYILPDGRVAPGASITDWDDLPKRTRMIIGYRGPFSIDRDTTAYRIAGDRHKNRDTIYFIPPRIVISGDKVADFTSLPKGTLVFLPN